MGMYLRMLRPKTRWFMDVQGSHPTSRRRPAAGSVSWDFVLGERFYRSRVTHGLAATAAASCADVAGCASGEVIDWGSACPHPT